MNMRWKRTMCFSVMLLLAMLVRPETHGATGQAQLGVDQRGRSCEPNFGFAYYTADTSMTDTCKTLDRSGNDTLIVTGGVASPENPEPVLLVGKSGSTATFTGRTGNCYYIVTGVYGGGGGGGGGVGGSGGTATWKSEFDSQRTQPHLVVTINDRDRSDDDVFGATGSLIRVELHDEANMTGGSTTFVLRQQAADPNGTAEVTFVDATGNAITMVPYVDADGNPVNDADGHPITRSLPYTVTKDAPNVEVYAKGAKRGTVIIIAEHLQ